MRGASDEFPLLSALGLYAAEIRGDGNCLFNALSDQLYGNQGEHLAIRTRIIDYMRENSEYYKQFIEVHPGGGVRRNPKRKNAGAYSTPLSSSPPTRQEVDRVFESHLQRMAKGGTYGDNMEISAFSAAYDVDVKIYQGDFAYLVSSGSQDERRNVAHIAYHTWEHYSSIRNLDGPHTGLPQVKVKALSPEEERVQTLRLAQTPHVLPWMVDVVSQSLPFLADKVTIKKTLKECKCNINAAVSKLLDAEEGGSVSSAQESSSVEREPDSDDDALNGPNKKRDRRLSRATRAVIRGKDQRKRDIATQLATHDASQSSFASVASLGSFASVDSFDTNTSTTNLNIAASGHDTEDSDSRPSSLNASASHTPAPSPGPQKGPTRLKINPPKESSQSTAHSRPAGRTQQKQPGPQRRGPTARERKDMKKLAQKAARKERAQADALGKVEPPKSADIGGGLPILIKGKPSGPRLESGIKTLFI